MTGFKCGFVVVNERQSTLSLHHIFRFALVPLADPHIRDRKTKAEGRAKFITPNGFRYSNPPKKGGLEKDYPEHMDEGTYGKRGPREKVENPAKKNVLTAPMRKGGYG